jgi:hypothetical protein
MSQRSFVQMVTACHKSLTRVRIVPMIGTKGAKHDVCMDHRRFTDYDARTEMAVVAKKRWQARRRPEALSAMPEMRPYAMYLASASLRPAGCLAGG